VQDSWKLWYHFAHGNRGAILWPSFRHDGKATPWWNEQGKLHPKLAHLPPIFKEMQSEKLASLLVGAELEHDGVAIYYSQPSIRAAWIMDTTSQNPGSWVGRSGGVDHATGSSINGRYAWMAMLEDAGIQFNFIDAPMLAAGRLKFPEYKVLILQAAHAVSDAELLAMSRFMEDGGTVIADYLPGIMDEHCRARGRGGQIFNGKAATPLEAEAYRKPLHERFVEGLQRHNGWPIARVGADSETWATRQKQKGKEVLLNLSPVPYLVNRARGERDENASRILRLIRKAGALSPIYVRTAGKFTEVLRWTKGDRRILCIVKSPRAEAGYGKQLGKLAGLDDKPTPLVIEFDLERPAGAVVNIRTGKKLVAREGEDGIARVMDQWVPCEAAIYQYRVKGK
jgi:hypothetical protein